MLTNQPGYTALQAGQTQNKTESGQNQLAELQRCAADQSAGSAEGRQRGPAHGSGFTSGAPKSSPQCPTLAGFSILPGKTKQTLIYILSSFTNRSWCHTRIIQNHFSVEFCCFAVLFAYLMYCVKVWGNTYVVCMQLFLLQKRALRIMHKGTHKYVICKIRSVEDERDDPIRDIIGFI